VDLDHQSLESTTRNLAAQPSPTRLPPAIPAELLAPKPSIDTPFQLFSTPISFRINTPPPEKTRFRLPAELLFGQKGSSMATAAQIIANQANSKLSTGPKTPEGQARVAQNAIRHGLTGKHLVIRPDEQEEFDSFQHELLAELNPQGPTESTVCQDLLHAAWNLNRLRRLESESSLGTIDDLTDPQTTAVLDRISRYQSRAQRAYYKALKELRILQTNRALRAAKLDPQTAAEVPAIADIAVLTKQSQSERKSAAIDEAVKMINYETGIIRLKAMKNLEAEIDAAAKIRPVADDRALRL
jgi:hypothetical protein